MENINEIKVEQKKHGGVLSWALIIAIVIVTNLFFNYATSLVYVEPEYDKYCPADIYNKAYDNKGQCLENGGMWSEQVVPVDTKVSGPSKTQITGYCNATYTCQKSYDADSKVYNRNVFIILVALGVIVIVAGAFVGVALLSAAFSWSGVLSLIIASMRYWSDADSIVRVVILGVALAALIWLAVKKFGNK
jgi:small-conductance mechanosensitive channel